MTGSCKNDDIICMASGLEMKILYHVIFHTATFLMFVDLYSFQVTDSSFSSSLVEVMNKAVSAQHEAFMKNLTKLQNITRNRSVIVEDTFREAVKNGAYDNIGLIALANSQDLNITECLKTRTFKMDLANASCQAGVDACLSKAVEGMFPDISRMDEFVEKAKDISEVSYADNWFNVTQAALDITTQVTKNATIFTEHFFTAEMNLTSCLENLAKSSVSTIRQVYGEEKLCIQKKIKPASRSNPLEISIPQ